MIDPKVTILNPNDLNDLLKSIGEMASVCVNKNPKNPVAVGKHCIEAEHGSALRLHYVQFSVEDISRCCANQMIRHKVGVEAMQESQRYVKTDDLMQSVVTPPSIINNQGAFNTYKKTVLEIEKGVKRLSAMGIPQEDLRYLYPGATHTKLIIWYSIQALMHFCNLRLCSRSQTEIRTVAKLMRNKVVEINPELKPYLVPKCLKLGYCNEGKSSCGKMPVKETVIK